MKDDDEDAETSATARYPILPSLIALQQMRNRLGMAHDGRRLMKWSASATRRELIKVAGQLDVAYASFAEDVGDAFMLLARSRYFYPNVNKMVLEMNTPKACITVARTSKNIAGCRSYSYQIQEICSDSYPCLGIDKGGEAILEAKQTWRKLLLRMIDILQLRKSFGAFDECNRAANKKANVLGKVIIPRTSMTIRYILSELEEVEREEFFRLKKVLEVKYRNKKKAGDKEKPQEKEKEEKKVRLPPEPSPVIIEPPVVEPPPPPPPPRPPPPEVKPPPPPPPPRPPPPVVKPPLPPPPPRPPPPVVKPPPPRPPPRPPPPPPEIRCIICGGPMHPKVKKPLTEKEIEQENAAIKELKETLSKVLNATEEYERKIDKKDSFKEFKQTASDLREKLQLLPPIPVIPDKVDVEKLCDICKELHNKKISKKCIVCGDCLVDKDDKIMAVAKESKRKLQQQLDTILNLVREYENQGLANDQIEDFKQTASQLKVKLKGPPIPCDVDVHRLCISCTVRYNEPVTPEPEPQVREPKMKSSKASTTIARTQKTKESSTTTSSAQPTPTESDVTLGVFETEEITEIVQVYNPDGTVSEKRREVKIKRKLEDQASQYDDQGPSGTSSFRDKKNVGLVSIIYFKKMKERLKVIDKPVIGLPISNRMIRDCVSSTFGLGLDDILESNSELYTTPRDVVSLDSSPSRTTNSSEYNSMNSFVDARSTQEAKSNSDDSVTNSEVKNDN